MELYQIQLLNILQKSINDEKFNSNSEGIIDWEKVIEEAREHDISALIYYSLDKETLRQIDKDILNKWKVSILKSNIIQIHILNSAKKILLGLQQKGVNVLALKGLILKNFYPRQEFRTMCDLDILIDIKDYISVKKYLLGIGYTCKNEKNPIHAVFYSESNPIVEVHWELVNKDYYIGNEKEFEKSIWKNAQEINIYDLKIKTLSDEDFLIHLCMHMAVHAKCSGLGIRQLYDLALFTKNKYEDIDWMNFKDRITKYGILTFTEGLYALCDKLFEIKAPFFYLNNTILKEEHINLLLENIINLGVSRKERIDLKLLYKNDNFYIKVKKIIPIVFENRKELSVKYSYVKNHFCLLPVAWIHRIFRAIRKYGLIKIFRYTKQEINIREKKREIVNIFNL
ncbi:nucleotidyltransferase family protein [Clostridium sp. C2-6-12]|uniref:nucleotidyltransferase domain-containing protein n=1 Tax=Clostridium sp. C2-6-12 TaxID=2698832 RepID=UPI001371D5C9|nr:nucleotidyltransferase family protein [Clostridium sp. C2-6-12]